MGGLVLAAVIFAASLALFPEWRTDARALLVLAALVLPAAFGFLANFRQAVEQAPEEAESPHIATGGGDSVSRDQRNVSLEHVNRSNVVVGDGNAATFVQQQTVHQQVNTPELETRRAARAQKQYLEAMKRYYREAFASDRITGSCKGIAIDC